jgi:2-oxoglutarate ferredoxin oxidoreductase subunit gamma
MECATVFAGFGGQGLLFAGQVLAQAALLEGRQVSWMPSYGPEMRGGTASCTVVVADLPIGSPIVDAPDCLVALNPPSLARYGPRLLAGGAAVVNSSLVEAGLGRPDVSVLEVPCSDLARAAGDERLASIVALGALVALRPIVAPDSVRPAIAAAVGADRPDLIEADAEAFLLGYRSAADRLRTRPQPAT